jgi:hypothetical protein
MHGSLGDLLNAIQSSTNDPANLGITNYIKYYITNLSN